MRTALFCILIGNVLGGVSYAWMKRAADGLPPCTIAFGRAAIGAACLGIWLLARPGARVEWSREDRRTILLTGVVACAVPLALGVVGTDLSTAANGSILILLEPVAIVAFARVLLGERMGRLRALGLAAGLAGGVIVALERREGAMSLFAGPHFVGNLALALSAVLWGLYTPLLTPVARRHAALPVTFAVTAVSAVALVPAALFESPRWEAGPALLPALGWTALMGVAISFLGTLLWTRALRDLPSGVIAPFIFLQPVVGVLVGVLWLHESVSSAAAAGGALVAAGVVLVILGEGGSPRPRGAGAADAA